MNEKGASCFPSTETLARETGLSERCVCTHLERAIDNGWLSRERARFGGQRWRRNSYQATIPIAVKKALNEVQHVGLEGTEHHSEGTECDDTKALNDVQSNSTYNSKNTSTHSRSSGDERVCAFLIFWEAYPRKEHKKEALEIWKRHHLDDQLPAILKDLEARKSHCAQWQRDGGRYIPLPINYLQGHLWHDRWTPPPRRSEYEPMRPRKPREEKTKHEHPS